MKDWRCLRYTLGILLFTSMETYFPWIVVVLLVLILFGVYGIIAAVNHLATFIIQVEMAVEKITEEDKDGEE